MSGIDTAFAGEESKSYPALALRRKRADWLLAASRRLSVQQFEIQRIDCGSKHGIALSKRRDPLLADLLFGDPSV